MPGLWGAAGGDQWTQRAMCRVSATDAARDGGRESRDLGRGVGREETRKNDTGGSMERGETTEPDGGVLMVAMAVCTLIAFVTGVAVGYGAALVLR